ncbi:MAG: helix-turn-helix domain-containing protein [Ectothiorhodospiraceae bacterium]
MSSLQTLSRGLTALELIAQEAGGRSVAELAKALGVHRAIAYRLVATLEQHALVSRGEDGRIGLGGGLVALASRVEPQLRALARPLLQELAERTRATAFLCVGHGAECVVVEVAEPESLLLRVSYRVGSRHPISVGAAGIAIASMRPEDTEDTEEIRQARRDGYSVTRGQLQAGAVGVAAPLTYPTRSNFRFEGCIGVVAMQDLDVEGAVEATLACARQLVTRMG